MSNFFSVSLYRCLMPPLKTTECEVPELEGRAYIAVTKVDHSIDTYFIRNYVRLDDESLNLELFFGEKPEDDH